jgi:hypothetical protein
MPVIIVSRKRSNSAMGYFGRNEFIISQALPGSLKATRQRFFGDALRRGPDGGYPGALARGRAILGQVRSQRAAAYNQIRPPGHWPARGPGPGPVPRGCPSAPPGCCADAGRWAALREL